MLREIDAMTAILARAGMLVMSWTLAAGAAAPAQLPQRAANLDQRSPQGTANVDQKAIGLYQQASADWLSNGRTYAEQRYSPLARITAGNVSRLGLAWAASLESTMFGVEATPLVANGVIYTTSSYSRVFAFDARTGSPLWAFDPKVARDRIRYGCCFPVNRGVAIWKGKVYVAAYDGRLIALDALTGAKLWEADTTGKSPFYTITGAPRVAGGKVIIGNGGSDFGTRGYFSAYDAESGRLVWRFYVVPDDPHNAVEQPELAMAARTWSTNHDWSKGGDGNPWDSFSYDPDAGLLYVGTGNGGWVDQPNNIRKGDELFVCSILAIHINDGRMAWYYQTTPHDIWDYDATQNMVLADLDIAGRTRKVLMQASKNGYFYVLDRLTGKLISATNYVRVNWAKGIDPKSGRPIPDRQANYIQHTRLVFPSANGAHNWPGMAFDPERKRVFIPARDSGFIYSLTVPTWYDQGYDLRKLTQDDVAKQTHGALIAWDPVGRKPAWQVLYQTLSNGGVLSTAGGLVAQGTQDGYLRFYSADDGRLLHQVFTGTGIVAPPVSYEVDGVQYFAFQTGWTGFNSDPVAPDAPPPYLNDARLIVLKLDGAQVPVADRPSRPPFLAIDTIQDPQSVAKGASAYLTYCSICHGHVGEETLVPDLRRMSPAIYDNFDAIVRGGLLKEAGMAAFSDVLKASDADSIRAFIVDWAQRSRRNDPSASQMPIIGPGADAPRLPGH
jgi:quinohemoprotein ethanol dehydrogenase